MMTYVKYYCTNCIHNTVCKYRVDKEKLEEAMGIVQDETDIPYSTTLSCKKYIEKSKGL